LPSLLFVRNFILKLKPTYTFPVFLVSFLANDADVDITDSVSANVTLTLADTPCESFYSSTIYDDYRSGGGAVWNKFDTSFGLAAPSFPIPNAVDWAYDKYNICPEDTAVATCCASFAGGPVPFDACFAYDTPVQERLLTDDTGPFVVPTGATGITLTPSGGATASFTSTMSQVRVLITGGPGADPDDYELVVSVNAVDQIFQAFTSDAGFTEVSISPAYAITAGDVIGLRIRHAGGVARNPDWTDIDGAVDIVAAQWTYDDSLPAGYYCNSRVLV
jgi:hypothetical protein